MFSTSSLTDVEQQKSEYVNARMTVVPVLIRNRKSVLFVQSSKDPGRMTWGLPQGGIGFSESLHSALVRECKEELGIEFDEEWISEKSYPLGTFLNVLPEGRECSRKLLHFSAVPMERYMPVILNPENRDFEWVKSWEQLWWLMDKVSRERTEKCVAIWHTINSAVKEKLLTWPEMPQYMSDAVNGTHTE